MPASTKLLECIAASALALTCLSDCSPIFWAMSKAREARLPRRTLTLGVDGQGDTGTPDERFHPSCAGRNEVQPDLASDHVWQFVPAAAGRYRFHLRGPYDTVLAVYKDDVEIACNDDAEGTDSEAIVAMHAGDTYLVVVDGYRGDHGVYTLRAEMAPDAPSPLRVPVEDLGTTVRRCRSPSHLATGMATGLFLATSGALAACGGRGVGAVYQLDVENAGTLRVSEVSPFEAVIELRRSCAEPRSAIACAHHAQGARYAVLSAPVEPGTYFVVLDATSDEARGPFAFNVEIQPATSVSAADAGTGADR